MRQYVRKDEKLKLNLIQIGFGKKESLFEIF